MEGVRKAILRIDCENGTKEAVSSPNEAARKILNHGSTDMAFGQEKCEIVVQYNPASIKYRAGNPFYYPTHQEINAARSDLA